MPTYSQTLQARLTYHIKGRAGRTKYGTINVNCEWLTCRYGSKRFGCEASVKKHFYQPEIGYETAYRFAPPTAS
jgi:hypothetical protein